MLDRAEGDPVAGREHERGHDRRPHERRAEQLAKARPPERAGPLLLRPHRALRQERPDEDQGQRGDHAGDERVAPGLVAVMDRRQKIGEPCGQHVGRAHEQTAERREGLRPAEHPLPLLPIRKQFREPGHGRHELDAHADEHQATKEEQLWQRRGEAGGQRREGVEQDAEREHPPPAEQVGEIAADEAEHAAGDRGHEEERPGPLRVGGRAGHEQWRALGRHAAERREGRLDDQRQHQEFVDVEREPDRRDRADEPAGE